MEKEGIFNETIARFQSNLPAVSGLKVGIEGVDNLTGDPVFFTVPAQRPKEFLPSPELKQEGFSFLTSMNLSG